MISRIFGKKQAPYYAAFLAMLTFMILFVLLATAIGPERYDIRVGEVAPTTIKAAKDVVDTITTEQRKGEAARAVAPNYTLDASVSQSVLRNTQDALGRLTRVNALAEPADAKDAPLEGAALYENARMILSPIDFEDAELGLLLEADSRTLAALTQRTEQLVREAMINRVSEGQVSDALSNIRRQLQSEEAFSEYTDIAMFVVQMYVKPNLLIDKEVTEANRQRARDEIEPIVYKKGQNIVQGGEVVTLAQFELLSSLGMLKNRAVDMLLYVGIGLFLLFLIGVVAMYLRAFEPGLLTDVRTIALLSAILVIVMFLCYGMARLHVYLMPVALGVMLTTLLIKPRLALIVNTMLCVLAGLLSSAISGLFSAPMFSVMIMTLVSGSLCVTMLRGSHSQGWQQRGTILLTGLVVGFVNTCVMAALGLINNSDLNGVITDALWSGASGLVAAVLCVGLQPALEWMFQLVTPSKLLELSNPNHPLIRSLLLEAPGTYHHSIIVANLSEAAADAVGANGLLTRVGAYFHDIGKLKRPLYFKENQMGDNPHDRTDPRVSAAILTAHTRDGGQLAQRYRIPEPIVNIIRQHHGDTPVLYFYDKAKKQFGENEVNIRDFRYDGPKPQSREAALIMLADTVEAAARSMENPSYEKMEGLIRRLIKEKIEDRQLDECALTFADVDKIIKAFMTVLQGVFHERVAYPQVEIPSRESTPPAMPAPKPEEPAALEGQKKPPVQEQAAPQGQAEKEEAPGEEENP